MRVEKFSVGRYAWIVVELIDKYLTHDTDHPLVRTGLLGIFQILEGVDPLINSKLNAIVYRLLCDQIEKGEQSLETFASELAVSLDPKLPQPLRPLFRSLLFNLKTISEWTAPFDERIYSILLYALEHLDEPEKPTAD